MRAAIKAVLDELEQQRQAEMESFGRPAGGNQGPTGSLDDRMLAVGPDSGQFLNTLIRSTGAKRVVEIGGSMGYSTIWQAEAVEANGGRMTTLEVVPAKIERLHQRIGQAGLESTVEVLAGDALQSLGSLEGPIDFVLVDAWKDDYPAYFDLVFPKLRVGGLMVADNITRPEPSGGILRYIEMTRNHPQARSMLIPVGSGLELTVKLA
jgi:predicted O-methyltransferase YrrM